MAFGAMPGLSEDGSDAERKDVFGLIQREIDEVSPNDFRTYCQYDVPLSSYVRQTGESQFAALRRLDDAFHKVVREVRATRAFAIGDAVIKTASSDHNGYLVDFTLTFEIAVNGYRIFHSGDSANIDKLNPVNAPDLWIVHPLCGLDPAKGVEKFRPKLTAVVHLNEMSHAKDRWRHTYESGLACVRKIEDAGGKAVMPLWGERLSSDEGMAGNEKTCV